MSPEYEKLIETVCPTLYTENSWGFSYGDGWFNITMKMSLKLEALAFEQLGPKVYVAQSKEKFGSLNVYLTYGTSEMQKIVNHYEKLSHSTCEECGDTGKTVNQKGKSNWIRTLCKECRFINEKQIADRQA